MAAGAQPLWHMLFKINAHKGFNLKLHRAGGTEADALTAANKVADALKFVMPATSEIFVATLSKDNTAKDSRLIRAARGAGKATSVDDGGADSFPNTGKDHILVRFENDVAGNLPLKLGPIPDKYVEDDAFTDVIADVVGAQVDYPAVSSIVDTWFVRVAKLLKTIMFACDHVGSGHPPGGAYVTNKFQNAYVLRPCAKRGGRVFT